MANNEHQGSSSGKRQAGYFCHLKIDEKHTGAILITDQIGVPLEFKYTEPVVVTKLHRILYGSSLDRYLHESVIRDRLAKELRTSPEFFLAPYEEKDYLGELAGKEMIAVQRIRPGQTDPAGPFIRIRDREAIVELEDGVQFRLAFSTADDAAQQFAVTWLQELSRTMDILEPMDRISSALRSICGDEKKV